MNKVAWYEDNTKPSGLTIHAIHGVRQKRPNELGLYDMAGNMDEIGIINGKYYSFGGDYCSWAEECRLDYIKRIFPNKSNDHYENTLIGLRFVIDAKDVDLSNINIMNHVYITTSPYSLAYETAYVQETENTTIVCLRIYNNMRFHKNSYLTAAGRYYKLLDVPDSKFNKKSKSWEKKHPYVRDNYVHLVFEKVPNVNQIESL